MMQSKSKILSILFLLATCHFSIGQIVQVGDGSYTTQFPGTDEAGRNGFPAGEPQLVGNAFGKPVPTNDWWSKLLIENHADNLYNYPMAMTTIIGGLTVNYVPSGPIGGSAQPIEVGVVGLSASQAKVADYSDWTVTMDWDEKFQATSGIAMPFLYFNKADAETAKVLIRSGSVTVSNEKIIVENAGNGADFVIYAPTGSTWISSGQSYTSTLNGQNYWSMVMLPQITSDIVAKSTEYQDYAYVFPTNTTTSWSFDEQSATMRTDFEVEYEVKEGTSESFLQGLLPHQWDNLSMDSPQPNGDSYSSIRGELKMLVGNTFSIENSFHGILPTLPYLSNYSDGFSLSALDEKVKFLENNELATWTDSYNEGQVMNELIQTARIADKMGNTVARDKIVSTIKERLENWLTAKAGEVAFIFYYNSAWSALLGYPAGHGQDNNINDHHFHWGYFIHAASFIEQFQPGWSDQYGEMINYLVRDAASTDREDALFPYLRNFSPFAGHCWANGFATFPQGNDQESTSESMQFNSSLIHWGSVTGNDAIRDLGIYLYTTEQSAVEEYWFDTQKRIFPENEYSVVSRVWGNDYDNGTFFTADIAASYGIELYPIHGGSMYLGHDIEYAEHLWAEMESNTGILENAVNPDLWHDLYYQYLAFTDPEKAIELYDSNPDRSLKFGTSDAQTYYWLHSMNTLGQVDASLTADHPLAVAFNKNGDLTYVAHNYSDAEITVAFSDNFELVVPARTLATNRDVNIEGNLTSSFSSAYLGGSVDLLLETESDGITKVEFYNDGILIGDDISEPFEFKAESLQAGVQGFYARMYVGENFDVSNIMSVTVGSQSPYSGMASVIPGVIEAGHYDKFAGSKGQGITYVDSSTGNDGDFRLDEDVDSEIFNDEGATIGWIAGGEWTEYTVDVQNSGYYEMSFRFASDNQNGGGPFHLELDGVEISEDISPTYTTGWYDWETLTVSNLAMPEGEHILRLAFDGGEFNIAKMTFLFQENLPYGPPTANAGENIPVILPATTTMLDGSLSSDPDLDVLTYSWEQENGPSVVNFSDASIAQPVISNLEKGIYTIKLTVDDGGYSSSDEVLVVVSETGNLEPSVSITSPEFNASFRGGNTIEITAEAKDLEGSVTLVEFYDGETKLGEDADSPYSYTWSDAAVGAHTLTAKATDDSGGVGISSPIDINVVEVQQCTEYSNVATEGSFSIGYRVTYESVGESVTVIFEILDEDKNPSNALLKPRAGSEVTMDLVSDRVFSKTFNGLGSGNTLDYACKFEYQNAHVTTEYFDYEVGTDCTDSQDTTAPENFTAAVGTVTFNSIELVLNGTEESGNVIYQANYNGITKMISLASGAAGTMNLTGLTENTTYSISVSAADISGNEAANSPLVLSAITTEDTNTDCLGTDSESQQGSFSIGYNYEFVTTGSSVEITFELLDDISVGNVFLWKKSPFNESQMTNVSGKVFTGTVTGLSNGEAISYACKFEIPNGQLVTKYFDYQVGDKCDGEVLSNQEFSDFKVYPNPTKGRLYLDWKEFTSASIFSLSGKELLKTTKNEIMLTNVPAGTYVLVMTGSNGEKRQTKFVKE
ncbi:MAG: carbohydrate-binding protein [Reichenbachiella sp.]